MTKSEFGDRGGLMEELTLAFLFKGGGGRMAGLADEG